jgi:hypothetical protein
MTHCAGKVLLPEVEFLEIAGEGEPPIPRDDAIVLGRACGVPEIDLNKMPTSADV